MLNRRSTRGAAASICLALACLLAPAAAPAAPPSAPTITAPLEGQVVHREDVHMEVTGFSDADGDGHQCTDWQIVDAATTAWRANCATGTDAIHIHLGDGAFVNGYTSLASSHQYTLQARFKDDGDSYGDWTSRSFTTAPPSSPGGEVPWTPLQPGYEVETVADDLQLPVNVAFVPNPGADPEDPLLYITELYGTIKVVTRGGSVGDYATGLLNFNPTGDFPGSGEQGLTGIVVDPITGDVFASLLYDDLGDPSTDHFPKVIRLHSNDGGLTAAGSPQTVLDMHGETQGASHQISNLSFGPDGKLYVHMGDGFSAVTALNLNSFRGKILRVNRDGSAPPDNPFFNGGTVDARDYIYAYGFRNPFGGAWRTANAAHYEVENALNQNDRFARVDRGVGYGWNGDDATMLTNALYSWAVPHAPVNVSFIQRSDFLGSGFPSEQMDHAFVTESGPTYATGPQVRGKRIVEFAPQDGGELGGHPVTLVEYTGTGKGTAAGLAAGPDGLYWTELYKDLGYTSPIDRGARLLRVRYVGTSPSCRLEGRTLMATIDPGQESTIARRADGTIRVDGEECGATILAVDRIEAVGAGGDEIATLDLAGGPLAPGYSGEADQPEIEVAVDLGPGDDAVVVEGTLGGDHFTVRGADTALNQDGDSDLVTTGVESLRMFGSGGSDVLIGDEEANLLDGGPGADAITGNGGVDVLRGRSGADDIFARDGGPDDADCGDGADSLRADDPGVDTITGCETIDFPATDPPAGPPRVAFCAGRRATVVGTAVAETLVGTPRRDVVAAFGGDDLVRGLAGNDLICGGAGADRLFGGKGRDRLLGQRGRDRLLGGRGIDRCDRRRGDYARSCRP